jgi:hypothetical protein
VTGGVPPVEEAVHETAVPTVPVLGHVMVTVNAGAVMTTDADCVLVAEFASVAVTEIVNVPAAL